MAPRGGGQGALVQGFARGATMLLQDETFGGLRQWRYKLPQAATIEREGDFAFGSVFLTFCQKNVGIDFGFIPY